LLHSVTTEDALPALMSVYFEVGAATLTMVATDRYRIPISVITIARDTTDEIPPFLIRGKLLDTLVKSAAGGNDKITLAASIGADGKVDLIGFSDGRKEITGRASQLEYVKWRTYIKPTDTAAVISADELAGAVKRCRVANDKDDKRPIALTFRDGALVVSASRTDGFAGEETVEQVRFNGEDGVCYWFKAPYLLDGLAGAHSDYLRIAFGPTPLKPVILTGADVDAGPGDDPADPAYQYVLMPVRNTD
jgi:DNA polymerase-3 subunit beta